MMERKNKQIWIIILPIMALLLGFIVLGIKNRLNKPCGELSILRIEELGVVACETGDTIDDSFVLSSLMELASYSKENPDSIIVANIALKKYEKSGSIEYMEPVSAHVEKLNVREPITGTNGEWDISFEYFDGSINERLRDSILEHYAPFAKEGVDEYTNDLASTFVDSANKGKLEIWGAQVIAPATVVLEIWQKNIGHIRAIKFEVAPKRPRWVEPYPDMELEKIRMPVLEQ